MSLLQNLYVFLNFFINFFSNFSLNFFEYLLLQSKHSNIILPLFLIAIYSKLEPQLPHFPFSIILFDKLSTKLDSNVDINLKLSMNFIL